MNGLDASEEAKPDERSKDEDSTDSGRGLGSARHTGIGVHRSDVSERVHAPATTRRRCGSVHPLSSEATVGFDGIDRANQSGSSWNRSSDLSKRTTFPS